MRQDLFLYVMLSKTKNRLYRRLRKYYIETGSKKSNLCIDYTHIRHQKLLPKECYDFVDTSYTRCFVRTPYAGERGIYFHNPSKLINIFAIVSETRSVSIAALLVGKVCKSLVFISSGVYSPR